MLGPVLNSSHVIISCKAQNSPVMQLLLLSLLCWWGNRGSVRFRPLQQWGCLSLYVVSTKAPWPPPLVTHSWALCPPQCDTGKSPDVVTHSALWTAPCLLNEALNFFRASGMSVSFPPVPRRVLRHKRHLINILLTKSVLSDSIFSAPKGFLEAFHASARH